MEASPSKLQFLSYKYITVTISTHWGFQLFRVWVSSAAVTSRVFELLKKTARIRWAVFVVKTPPKSCGPEATYQPKWRQKVFLIFFLDYLRPSLTQQLQCFSLFWEQSHVFDWACFPSTSDGNNIPEIKKILKNQTHDHRETRPWNNVRSVSGYIRKQCGAEKEEKRKNTPSWWDHSPNVRNK